MAGTPQSMEEVYAEILTGLIRTDIKLDILLSIQAELLAIAAGTSKEAELATINHTISVLAANKRRELGFED